MIRGGVGTNWRTDHACTTRAVPFLCTSVTTKRTVLPGRVSRCMRVVSLLKSRIHRSPFPRLFSRFTMGQYMSLRDAYVVHKPSYPSTLDISLTEEEAKLFELLDNFTKQLLNDSNQNVECRVAGGWVRDKVSDSRLCPS